MATSPKRLIDDAGEKIEGARKDWSKSAMEAQDLDGMTDEEIVLSVRKDHVWPKPDYEALVAGGMDPAAAALVKIVRDRMAQEPRAYSGVDPVELRRLFVDMTAMVRDRLLACRTESDVRSVYGLLKQDFGGGFRLSREAEYKTFSVYKGRSCPFAVDFTDQTKAKKMLQEGFPSKVPAWRKGLSVVKFDDGYALVRDRRLVKDKFADEATALAWAEENAGKAGNAAKPKAGDGKLVPDRPHLDRIERSGMGFSLDGRNVSPDDFLAAFGFRGVQFGLWLPDDERQRVLNMGYEALMDLAEVLGWEPEALSLGGTLGLAFGARGKGGKAAAHYEPGQRVVNMTRMSGAGTLAHEYGHALDHWTGTGTEVAMAGGIPSATGWKSYLQDRRKSLAHRGGDVPDSWDGLMSRIYKSPVSKEKAIAKAEKRLAAYEEGIARNRIGIDRQLSLEEGKRNRTYLRKALEWEAQKKIEVAAVRKGIEQLSALAEADTVGEGPSDYLQEANKLCRSNDYWRQPTELFARAFEAWVEDEVAARGGRSEYLVYAAGEEFFSGDEFRGNPYPCGDERQRINEAMTGLAAAMKPCVEEAMAPQSPTP